jgi:hypothetical protein
MPWEARVGTELIGVISDGLPACAFGNALWAWGPIHDNHAPHNVDDDADPCSVRLSNIVTDFETLHGTALVMLNSRISCIHSSGLGLKASVERRSSAMAFVNARMINRR